MWLFAQFRLHFLIWVLAAIPVAAADFDRVVEVAPEVIAAGKVSGLVRNVGQWTIKNVRLRVDHRWSWPDGGSYRKSLESITQGLILPGDPAGFASVHLPPPSVPESASYSMKVTVLEVTQIRMSE